MRKILLTLSALFAFGVAQAQNDISITLNSPTAGSTIGPGLPLSFDVTMTNLGSVAVSANDTLIYFPTIGGNILTTTQNGQTVTVAFRLTGTTIATNGSETRSVNFGGLTLGTSPAGNYDFCGNVRAFGPNWSNVTESDTINNVSCASVSYDPNGGGGIGIAENVISGELNSLAIVDASYANGGFYFVEAYNLSSSHASVSFVDLTGRTLLTQEFEVRNSELNGEISLNSVPKGVVLAVLSVDGQAVSTKKVVVGQ